MTQQLSPQSPPPEGAPYPAPLWYQETQALPQYGYPTVDPQAPTEPRRAALTQPGATPPQSGKPRRLAEIGAIAVVAAVLASAGTYAATRTDVASFPLAQISASPTTSSAQLGGSATTPNWSATAATVSPSVVAIAVTSSQASGQGSGVIFDTQGHILTCLLYTSDA